jgi:tyrosine-protein phosphatase non-receptor type 4
MDTALALMEAKEPVYPLDIVQAMRDQRASMVQNVVSNHYTMKF